MIRQTTALVVFLLVSLAMSFTARADEKGACADAYGKAQRLRGANQLVSAREQLRVCARPTCTKFIARDCAAWLVDVESRLPSIVLFARDASGAELSQATVSIDGSVIAEQLDGHAIEVDGGHHEFTFVFPDGTKIDQSYVVFEGQKAQRLGVTLPPAHPPDARASATAPPTRPSAVSDTSTRETASWNGRKTFAVVVGGIGVAGLALGTVFGMQASASYSNQQNACHSAAPGDCSNHALAQTDHTSAVSESTFSTLGFVAGGALVASAALLFLTAPQAPERTDGPASAALQVLPIAGPAGAGLWMRGGF
jgi:hypothetical protein